MARDPDPDLTTFARVSKALARGSRYKPRDFLGRGSTSEVLAVFDTERQQQVALKILRPDTAGDEEIQARFEREVRLARRIQSDHVARVLDSGVLLDRAYVTMELVEGDTLLEILEREGPLPVDRTLHIARDALRGLAAAHALGIVHRDVKPSNLIVDQTGTTKVMDFGLAKAIGDSHITQPGTVLGTPSYLSPEAIGGTGADARSDVYSFGCTLFHVLTGAPPFQGASILETTMMHLRAKPPALRDRDPGVPEALDAIVARCLEKSPAARYADAGELGTALAGIE